MRILNHRQFEALQSLCAFIHLDAEGAGVLPVDSPLSAVLDWLPGESLRAAASATLEEQQAVRNSGLEAALRMRAGRERRQGVLR